MDEDLDGFMSFLVIFMGCPQHINNPYLRAHMVDVSGVCARHVWRRAGG